MSSRFRIRNFFVFTTAASAILCLIGMRHDVDGQLLLTFWVTSSILVAILVAAAGNTLRLGFGAALAYFLVGLSVQAFAISEQLRDSQNDLGEWFGGLVFLGIACVIMIAAILLGQSVWHTLSSEPEEL